MILIRLAADTGKDTRSTVVPHKGESTRHAWPCEYPDTRCDCPARQPLVVDSAESIQRAHRRARVAAYFVSARWARTVREGRPQGGAR